MSFSEPGISRRCVTLVFCFTVGLLISLCLLASGGSFSLLHVTFFPVVSVTLVIDAPLDYEVSPIHYLTLETSNGRFSIGNTLMLVINVTDVNDNAPVFGQGGYSAEIMEDLTPGALVMKVREGRGMGCRQ